MEAIVEQNLETKKFIVSCWRKDEAPSGYVRVLLFAQSGEMDEAAAKDLCDRQNEKFKLTEKDRRSN